jgi:hypothetical protein
MTVPIFTSSWRTPIDDTKFVRVAISRGTPRGKQPGASGFRKFSKLAPGKWFSDPIPATAWAERYRREVLAPLDPAKTVADLRALSDGVKPIVLLCWEAADDAQAWCHRGLTSQWFHEALGLEVYELGYERCGCGARHPKLPEVLRQR